MLGGYKLHDRDNGRAKGNHKALECIPHKVCNSGMTKVNNKQD